MRTKLNASQDRSDINIKIFSRQGLENRMNKVEKKDKGQEDQLHCSFEIHTNEIFLQKTCSNMRVNINNESLKLFEKKIGKLSHFLLISQTNCGLVVVVMVLVVMVF
jgi:hypothetical protein